MRHGESSRSAQGRPGSCTAVTQRLETLTEVGVGVRKPPIGVRVSSPPRCCRNYNVFPVHRLYFIGFSQRRKTLMFEPLCAGGHSETHAVCGSKQMSTLSPESVPPSRHRTGLVPTGARDRPKSAPGCSHRVHPPTRVHSGADLELGPIRTRGATLQVSLPHSNHRPCNGLMSHPCARTSTRLIPAAVSASKSPKDR